MRLLPIHEAWLPELEALYQEGLAWAPDSRIEAVRRVGWAMAANSPDAVWRACVLEDGTMIGLAGAEKINLLDGTCEPFVAIKPAYRRGGHGLEMSEMLHRFLVNEYNMRRIQTSVLEDAPSRSILEKMGFVVEGVAKQARFRSGKYVDVYHYAWIRS